MIRLTNQSAEAQTYSGVEIQPGGQYEIPALLLDTFIADAKLRHHIATRIISVSDGYADSAGNEGLEILDRNKRIDVVTLYEKNDKIPRYASVIGTFDLNGDCILSVKIPGELSPIATRYMSLAYFVTDVFGWGDRITKIEITDEDNLLGAGAGYVVDALHDIDLTAANQGWYFYPSEGGKGEVEVTPSDKFGELNGGLYIKATLKRAVGSPATKALVNLDWGAKR